MVDLVDPNNKPRTLQSFIEKENGYDIAFARAWSVFTSEKSNRFQNSKQMLQVLDRIQDLSLSHLPALKHVNGNNYIRIRGKVDSQYNWFDLSKDWNTDPEGLTDIIHKVWNDTKLDLALEMRDENEDVFLFNRKGFFKKVPPNGLPIHMRNGNNDEKVLLEINNRIFHCFNLPHRLNNLARMFFSIYATPEARAEEATRVAKTYLREIQSCKSNDEKLKIIANTLRDLLQIHMYWDGNGRSLYIFANLLLYQNDLSLCYPKNMAIFEVYSIPRIIQEIKEGQKRFTEMFGNETELSNGIKAYAKSIEELSSKLSSVDEGNSLSNPFQSRDLNLLLRRAASSPKCIDLLKFLLGHTQELNIDIHSRGKTSGSALEVATLKKNQEAVDLLKSHNAK
jgi:hypothetical protein